MSRLGMDVDLVADVGLALRERGQEFTTVVDTVDALVSDADAQWWGPRSEDFVAQWRTVHRPRLVLIAGSVTALGDNVMRNVAEQNQASSVEGLRGMRPTTMELLFGPDAREVVGTVKNIHTIVSAPTYLGWGMVMAQWVRNYERLGGAGRFGQGLGSDVLAVLRVGRTKLLGQAGLTLAQDGEWERLPQALSRLPEGSWVKGLFRRMPAGSAAAEMFAGLGKIIGPVGAALNVYSTATDFLDGKTGRGVYDAVLTAASIAAMIPGVGIAGASVAAGMTVGQLVYDHWGDITAFGSGVSQAITGAVGSIAKDPAGVAQSVGASLNPASWY